jgi:L-fucose isomerase-like protein
MKSQEHLLVSKVAVGSLSSPLEIGADRAPTVAAELATLLNAQGCSVVPLGPVITPDLTVQAGNKAVESHVDAVVLVATSWYEDYLVLELWEECPVPIFLWSLPGMETGALCGNQQLTTYLKQLEIPFQCFYGRLDDPAGAVKAKSFLQACALKRKLRRSRIGLAGHRVAGMTEVSANEMNLKKSIGPRIVPLNLPQLIQLAKEVSEDEVRSIWKSVRERSGKCKVSDETGLE